MKILITNDDGIENIGIRLLAEWAKKLGEVTVVAPKKEQSAKSHSIDLANAIEIKKVPFMDGVTAYSVDSTPADCVRFGFLSLDKFDLVLSGINYGINVGVDIMYSGTVAAIFEGARMGAKGIAFSAFFGCQEQAAKHLDAAYDYIMKNGLLDVNPIYNVNIPNESKGVRITYQGSPYFSDRFISAGEENMYRQDGDIIPDECPNDLNRDTVAVCSGYISITPLLATRTNMEIFEKYKQND